MGLLAGRDIDRDIYLDLLKQFEKSYPKIKFDHLAANDTNYKTEIGSWLSARKVDLSYGQVGSPLCQLALEGKIAALDNIWQENNWDRYFSENFKRSASCHDKVYGLPLAYYYWGFFYKKSLFSRLGLSVPGTWQQFLDLGQQLKANNLVPVTIGTKNKWPAAAWFDYIDLRLNGLEFHLSVARGEISFLSPKVRTVFEHWQKLVEQGFFIEEQQQMDWQQALPFLYRDMAGMILTGSFLINILPDNLRNDVGFFRFPVMDETIPLYEEVPQDVIMLNQLSVDNEAALILLEYMSTVKSQSYLNQKLGYLPPNINVQAVEDAFTEIGLEHIKGAAGHSQYFDRDAHITLATKAPTIFTDFVAEGDIESALTKLENIRLSISQVNLKEDK